MIEYRNEYVEVCERECPEECDSVEYSLTILPFVGYIWADKLSIQESFQTKKQLEITQVFFFVGLVEFLVLYLVLGLYFFNKIFEWI